jgi:RNA polymerase sigma factor (TIGR02999 family)
MTDVTRILAQIQSGAPGAAERLWAVVYDELRNLAAAKLHHEPSGQTLEPTALVHEAYLRLIGPAGERDWDSRAHFFSAAAEAMRRILVDNARRKQRRKHGGGHDRVPLDQAEPADNGSPDELLLIDEALNRLAAEDPQAADVVRMCYFAGLAVDEAAELLGMSRATAYRHWNYAKAWLHAEVRRR